MRWLAFALCVAVITGANGGLAQFRSFDDYIHGRGLQQESQRLQDQDLFELVRLPVDETTQRKVESLLDRGADPDACCDIFGQSALHEAARYDNDVVALALLREGGHVDILSSNGDTPLHVAAEEGSARVTNILLEGKAQVNIQNNYGETPLHVASRFGHAKITKLLLKFGADKKIRDDDGMTPLDVACKTDCPEDATEIPGFLVTAPNEACDRHPYVASLRDSVNQHQCAGVLIHPSWVLTAAHCVDAGSVLSSAPRVVFGDCDLDNDARDIEIIVPKSTVIFDTWNGKAKDGNDIALLHLSQASIHQPIPLPPSESDTPFTSTHQDQFFVAVGYEDDAGDGSFKLQQDLNTKLVESEACGDPQAWGLSTIKNTMVCAHGLDNGQSGCKGDSGGDPLLVAFAPNGDVSKGVPQGDVLTGITSFGDNDSPCGSTGLPGVYTKVSTYVEWIRRVIDSDGADSKSVGRKEQRALDKRLLRAARRENLQQIREAIADGADPNATLSDEEGGALHIASRNGYLEVVKIMIAAGADLDLATEYDGSTPLVLSAETNHPEITAELVVSGADVNKPDHNRNTPLIVAAHEGRLAVSQALLASPDVDVELGDSKDNSPLWIAADEAHAPIVKALLQAGADPNHADDDSIAPVHVAAGSMPGDASEEVMEMLIEAGVDVNAVAVDPDGVKTTPLWYAAARGNAGTARLLVRNGAEVGADLGGGKTAADFVCFCEVRPKQTRRCHKGGCDKPQIVKELTVLLKGRA